MQGLVTALVWLFIGLVIGFIRGRENGREVERKSVRFTPVDKIEPREGYDGRQHYCPPVPSVTCKKVMLACKMGHTSDLELLEPVIRVFADDQFPSIISRFERSRRATPGPVIHVLQGDLSQQPAPAALLGGNSH